jgi:uncharacterized membrane protein YkoI
MHRRNRLVALAVAIVAIAAGTGIVIASGTSDEDAPLVGTDLERATQAALAHTGGGTVIESEAGDDGAVYGIEIQLEDGSVVEVNLDADFNVIGSEADDDGASEDEGAGDN